MGNNRPRSDRATVSDWPDNPPRSRRSASSARSRPGAAPAPAIRPRLGDNREKVRGAVSAQESLSGGASILLRDFAYPSAQIHKTPGFRDKAAHRTEVECLFQRSTVG